MLCQFSIILNSVYEDNDTFFSGLKRVPSGSFIKINSKEKVISLDGDTILELGDKVIMCLLHDAIQKVEFLEICFGLHVLS